MSEEWCHQGQLSLRKVVCTCGMSRWHCDKTRGLSQSKGGQQEPAFPQRAPAVGGAWTSGSRLMETVGGRRVSTPAWTLAASGWTVGAKLFTEVGAWGCLVIWGAGRGTSLVLIVGLAGPSRCFLLPSVLLCPVGLCFVLGTSLCCLSRGWSRPFCSNQFCSARFLLFGSKPWFLFPLHCSGLFSCVLPFW